MSTEFSLPCIWLDIYSPLLWWQDFGGGGSVW